MGGSSAHGMLTDGLTRGGTSGSHRYKIQWSSTNHVVLAARFSQILPSLFSLCYILLSCICSLHTLFYSSKDKINKDKSISGMNT